jgi:hypothetical protein
MFVPIVIGLFVTGYILENYAHVSDRVSIYFGRFRELNSAVAAVNKSRSCISVIGISISMLLKTLWIWVLQRIDNRVIRVRENLYEVRYVINGRLYKLRVYQKRGPAPIAKVVNSNCIDVSHMIIPYVGPGGDFHNQPYTPETFGESTLEFELYTGEIITFERGTTLEINIK